MKKVGIVGCGNIAAVHAVVLREIDQVCLTAFADSQITRAQHYASSYGKADAGVYQSLTKMIQDEDLDVVHICTPHHLHVPMAIEVLKKGISAFIEKPPAIDQIEFEELLQAERDSAGIVGVCFQNRYNYTTTVVEQLLRDNAMGKILGARAFVTWRRDQAYYLDSGWRGKWETEGGGALINQSIHTLDLLIRFIGKPDWIEATMSNHHLKNVVAVEDTLEAYLLVGNKRICFYATNAYIADVPVLIEIECEQGRIRLEGAKVWCNFFDGREDLYEGDSLQGIGKSYWGQGHQSCISDFYACLEEGRDYQNDLASVISTMKVMLDIYHQAKVNERRQKIGWNR